MKKNLIFIMSFYWFGIFAQNINDPVANPLSVVTDGNVRFTILTSQLIRLEWDSLAKFENHSSFVIVNRNLPVVKFKQSTQDNWLIIQTDKLILKYLKSSGKFTSENLQITFLDSINHFDWKPGLLNSGNLKGTSRTLDRFNGDTEEWGKFPIPLEEGLISKDGWYVIDDSKNFLFDNTDWKWVLPRQNKNVQDWYFFGYGKNYKSVLSDFIKVAGKIPMPPRYAFGYWWSRYWNYSENELRELIGNFDKYKIPLDVLVIDMDWHITKGLSWLPGKFKTDEFGESIGWTGYTWNKSLFPEPEKFLKWTDQKNIKTTLNLHPASGVEPWEDRYAEFAKAMHFDTTGHKNVPYECADKKFMENLFKIILHPLQDEGIDFWWLDWQQWKDSKKIPGLSNTWWLNYCFFTDMERQKKHRPMLYHRWGGLGNHRYQIGFSGDAIISWNSLNFQPYFTNCASNVLYGYWSHDIGGHMFGAGPEDQKKLDPELYVRWMQYGALSPIFRTHSSKDARLNKEVWNFAPEYSNVLIDAIRLRYALNPYIYTMAREAYETGVSLCRPMYYNYPDKQEAYDFRNQYMFGDDMMVAPITSSIVDNFAAMKIWLPAGNDWYEWSTGTMLKGGQIIERKFLLNEYPIYVKAGAVIPMYPEIQNLQQLNDEMIIRVFPGGSYKTTVYEDAGDDNEYQAEGYAFTDIKTEKLNDKNLIVTISPTEGSYDGMSNFKKYEIQLYGSSIPQTVFYNGKPIPFSLEAKEGCWNYSGNNLCVHIKLPLILNYTTLKIDVTFPDPITDELNGLIGKTRRLSLAVNYLKNHWGDGSPLPEIIANTELTNLKIDYNPFDLKKLVNEFQKNYSQIPDLIRATHLNDKDKEKCINYLK